MKILLTIESRALREKLAIQSYELIKIKNEKRDTN